MEIKESHNAKSRRESAIYVSGVTSISRQPSFLTNLRMQTRSALKPPKLHNNEVYSVIYNNEIVFCNNDNSISLHKE